MAEAMASNQVIRRLRKGYGILSSNSRDVNCCHVFELWGEFGGRSVFEVAYVIWGCAPHVAWPLIGEGIWLIVLLVQPSYQGLPV